VQLNRDEPLARGLLHYWVMNETGSNALFDLVSRVTISKTGSPAWDGRGWKSFSGSDYFASADNATAFTDPNQMSFAASYTLTGDPTAVRCTIYCSDDAGTAGIPVFEVGYGETAGANCLGVLVPGLFVVYPAAGSIAQGETAQVLYTRTAAKANAIYKNGVPLTLISDDTSTAFANSTTKRGVGIRLQSLGNEFIGTIHWVALWDRTLSPVEALRLAQDPYCMLAPARARRWRPSSDAAPDGHPAMRRFGLAQHMAGLASIGRSGSQLFSPER
jgi:hypothetical protein